MVCVGFLLTIITGLRMGLFRFVLCSTLKPVEIRHRTDNIRMNSVVVNEHLIERGAFSCGSCACRKFFGCCIFQKMFTVFSIVFCSRLIVNPYSAGISKLVYFFHWFLFFFQFRQSLSVVKFPVVMYWSRELWYSTTVVLYAAPNAKWDSRLHAAYRYSSTTLHK